MNHIKSMAELLHAEAIQQLEVALLGSPAVHVIDLLSAGWTQTKPAMMTTAIWPPQAYTLMPSALPPPAVPIVGVTSSAPVEVSAPVEESPIPRYHQITPTPIWASEPSILSSSSSSSGLPTKSVSYPTIVVPELTMPVEAYPKQLNQPGGRKEYWCSYVPFVIQTLTVS